MKTELKKEDVSSFLDYNMETGVFKWKFREQKHFRTKLAFSTWNNRFPGKEAGSIQKDKWGKEYRIISIFDHPYKAHRLAVLLVTGKIPELDIDHINGVGTDNSWKNIRLVTNDENQKNKKRPRNNTSGTSGVYFDKVSGMWRVTVQINNKQTYIGKFELIEDAVLCRKNAEREHGYHENHGR